MAKGTLLTNYVDDILNASMNGKRKYNLIQNDDGTVSLEDVTTYDQIGSDFSSAIVNAICKAVNESADKNKILETLDEVVATTEKGYIPDALALKEVNNSLMSELYYQPGEIVNMTWWSFFYGFTNGTRLFITTPLLKKITRNSSFEITGLEIDTASGVIKFNTDELIASLTVVQSGTKNGCLYLVIDTTQNNDKLVVGSCITGQIKGNLVVN